MKIVKHLIISVLISFPMAIFADNTMQVTNATGCLLNLENMTYSVTKPVPVYVFIGDEKTLKYSGVEIDPGQTSTAPMGTSISIQPPAPALLLGASPGDAQSHITFNIIPPTPTLVVQSYGSMGSGETCPINYPCIQSPVGDASKCVTLLKKAGYG